MPLAEHLPSVLHPRAVRPIARRPAARSPAVASSPGVVDVTADDLALDATGDGRAAARRWACASSSRRSASCATASRGGRPASGWPGSPFAARASARWLSPDHVGDATFVVDYLRSEWTGQLSAEDRQFLGEAACLAPLHRARCATRSSGAPDRSPQLRRMHREELLVLPLDQRDEWFRMHPLLTRWLSSELQEIRPGPVARRSTPLGGRWWAEHGDIDLAFEHAIAMQRPGARRGAGRRARLQLPDAAACYTTVRRWLAAFPADRAVVGRAVLPCTRSTPCSLGDGARSSHWYEQLERVLGSQPRAVRPSLRLRADVLRITLSHASRRATCSRSAKR